MRAVFVVMGLLLALALCNFAHAEVASGPQVADETLAANEVASLPSVASLPAFVPSQYINQNAKIAAPRLNAPMRTDAIKPQGETALALRIIVILTVMALVPAMLVSLTAFLRIIIVLSMLRHAIGLQETPPNTALIGLALFLTIFTMSPVLQKVNQEALQPFTQGKISVEMAYDKGSAPLRDFMVRQTREQDLALMVELSKAPTPKSIDEISNIQLVPAFMLSELRSAFQIGFVVFLPFLLIDLLVSSILMALGMMMMPPVAISLPLKILMFLLVDGWSVLLKGLIGSFH